MDTMLTPHVAAIILLATVVLLLIVIPLLDGSEKFGKFISLRYTLVALSLIMALGCILDFSHLSESSRNIVLMGGMILVGIFVLVRSLEKMKLGGKVISVSAQKGDIKLSASLHNKDEKENVPAEPKNLACTEEVHDCNSEEVECCDPGNERSEE